MYVRVLTIVSGTGIDLTNIARCHNILSTKINMTGGDITNIHQDTEASVVSGITSVDSINTDRGLSVNDKKRKTNEIYLSAQWNDEDEYEVTKLRQVIRNHIFKHVKFVKGEGAVPSHKKENKSRQLKQLLFGKCHERPDLTILTGYECQILRMVGLSEENTSVTRHALWWKTYNSYVHQEIRQLRGRMNAGIKLAISQGE